MKAGGACENEPVDGVDGEKGGKVGDGAKVDDQEQDGGRTDEPRSP